MVDFLKQRSGFHGFEKILGVIASRSVGAERDVHASANHFDDGRNSITEHHVADGVV